MGYDLATFAFQVIANTLYDPTGVARPFTLPPKGGTQDDPFDRFLLAAMQRAAPAELTVSGSVLM